MRRARADRIAHLISWARTKEDGNVFQLEPANFERTRKRGRKQMRIFHEKASVVGTRAFRRPQISVHAVLKVSLKFMTGCFVSGKAKNLRLEANYTLFNK